MSSETKLLEFERGSSIRSINIQQQLKRASINNEPIVSETTITNATYPSRFAALPRVRTHTRRSHRSRHVFMSMCTHHKRIRCACNPAPMSTICICIVCYMRQPERSAERCAIRLFRSYRFQTDSQTQFHHQGARRRSHRKASGFFVAYGHETTATCKRAVHGFL